MYSRARAQPRDFSPLMQPSANIFNVQHHLASAQTHRTFHAAAMNTRSAAVAAARNSRAATLSRSSFDNVTKRQNVYDTLVRRLRNLSVRVQPPSSVSRLACGPSAPSSSE